MIILYNNIKDGYTMFLRIMKNNVLTKRDRVYRNSHDMIICIFIFLVFKTKRLFLVCTVRHSGLASTCPGDTFVFEYNNLNI